MAKVDSYVQFLEKEIVYVDHPIKADLCTELYSLGRLYFVGKSNPGFDYFYRERTTDGHDILVLVEGKFSDTMTENQRLGAPDVQTKLAYCARALESSGSGVALDYHKVYVIFLAMRSQVTNGLLGTPIAMAGDIEIPSRTDQKTAYCPFDKRIVGIVLDRELMKDLLGDPLFYRAMFTLEPY